MATGTGAGEGRRGRGRRPVLTDDGVGPAAYEVDPATGCRLWTRGLMHGRYPAARYGGKTVRAYAHAYEKAVGPVPPGHTLRPTCPGGERCINPAHRWPVPKAEVMRALPGLKLGGGKAEELRRRAATEAPAELAAAFGVGLSTVYGALAGASWGGEPDAGAQPRPRSCPTRRRWAGRLPAARPPGVPAAQWEALVLFVAGRSLAEVAAAQGVGRACAWGRVKHASRKLAALLGGGG